MPQKLGRNDPCWCGSGKKLKKCHGAGPIEAPRVPLSVAPARPPAPITTHKAFDGEKWGEHPGLLSAVIGIQPAGSVDADLAELRRAWGTQLERNDINGLAACLNDVAHKLQGVRYHRNNFEHAEGTITDRFRANHAPPAGVAVEELVPELLFEIEGFLYQVKSTLDMLARLLSAAGLRSMGHSFGDHGDRVLKQLDHVPQSCSAEARELQTLIESAQPVWIDQTVSFRDEIAHKGMLDEFRCFVQEPFVGTAPVPIHFPEMPGGERASAYIERVESELRSFVDAVVKIAIRIAMALQRGSTDADAPG